MRFVYLGDTARVYLASLLAAVHLAATGCTTREDDVALHNTAVAYLYQHKHDEAERLFAQIVAKYPGEFIPRLNLAISQLNQITDAHLQAALASLEAAEKIDPTRAETPYCRGIILYHRGKYPEATAEFERAVALAPGNPDAHLKYASALRDTDREEEAIPHFEAAARGNPLLKTPWHNLQFYYRSKGRDADAARASERFEALDQSKRGIILDVKYTEMGSLADGITGWIPPGRAPGTPRFAAPVAVPGVYSAFAFVDSDVDCHPELWCAGAAPSRWDLSQAPSRVAALPELKDAHSFAAGDVNDDLRLDLVVSTPAGIAIYLGQEPTAAIRFEKSQTLAASAIGEVRLADLDLESDLDLVFTSAAEPPGIAINASGTFTKLPAPELVARAAVFGEVERGARLALLRDLDRDGDLELLFAGASGVTVIDNGPMWEFEMVGGARRPSIAGGVRDITAADLDADGDEDLVVAGPTGGIWWNDGKGRFPAEPEARELVQDGSAIHVVDVDLDGWLDLVVCGAASTRIVQNLGGGRLAPAKLALPPAIAIASADVDGDLDVDLVLGAADGTLRLLRNEAVTDSATTTLRAVRLYFGGDSKSPRYSNRYGIGARYELRAGNLVQYGTYDGGLGHRAQGLAPRVIGIGDRTKVELVLVRWPDQVIQSELEVPVGRCHVLAEVQRKPESCPILFAWDGTEYRFIGDFLGGGGLGIWTGPGRYESSDPTETVRIGPEEARPIQDRYRLSIMEPMEEVSYIDRIGLRAVDHPAELEVFPDELLSLSPEVAATGEALAIDAAKRAFPVRAFANEGQDVLDRLLAADRRTVDDFSIDPVLFGYAEPHTLEFGFGADLPRGGDVRLFLHGWIEYPYSRTNFAAWQAGRTQSAPSFYWREGPGDAWRLLYERVGFPAGFPKTMVLPIADAVARGAREFRIDTDMEIYWDRIFAAEVLPPSRVVERPVPLVTARLGFGGYPRWYSGDGARPSTYHYGERDAHIDFKRFEGTTTPYGEVNGLLAAADDRFVILGTGDEISLDFDAAALPPLPAGWTRTLLLDAHGYCKSMDPLGASPRTIEPLPYAGMPCYPPSPPHERDPHALPRRDR